MFHRWINFFADQEDILFIHLWNEEEARSILLAFFWKKKRKIGKLAIQFLVFFNFSRFQKFDVWIFIFILFQWNFIISYAYVRYIEITIYIRQILLFLYLIMEIRIFLLSYPFNSKLVLVGRNKNGFVGSIDEKSFHFHEKFSWAN